MKKEQIIVVSILILVLIVTAVVIFTQRSSAPTNTQSQTESSPQISSKREKGLGLLCSGEKECVAFCANNRGRCEVYCKGNENELCRLIFRPVTSEKRDTPPNLDCKNDTQPLFTKPFTDLSKINHIMPLGNVKAGSLSRSYISVKREKNDSKVWAPLFAPTNATLFRIAYAYRGDPAQGGRAEYRIDFRVSCEVTFGFDHIANISERLKQFAPTEPTYMTRGGKEVSVPVIEGELIGFTNGGLIGGAWDFLLFNYAKEVSHINPSRWTSEHNKYADCPYDYFTEDLRKQYYAMFASAGGERAQNSTCRSASRDVAGTLSGGWFKGNATDVSGARIIIGSDYSTVDLVVDENDPRAMGSVLSIRHQNAPKKPEDVLTGGSVCYTDGTNHAFLKLLSDTQMASSIGNGSCPSTLPQEYEIWER